MNTAEAGTIQSYDQDNNAQTVQRYDCHVHHKEEDNIAHLLCLVSQHQSIFQFIVLHEDCLSLILNCKKNTNPYPPSLVSMSSLQSLLS